MKLISLVLITPALVLLTGDPKSASIHFHQQSILTGGRGPRAIAVADVNRDGNPDILVTNTDSGSVTVFLGDGRGQFVPARGSPFAAGSQPNDIGVADMNGDGKIDLVIPNHQTPYITVLLGDGEGRFVPAPGSPFDVHSNPHPHGVAVADFDGDGHPDVATDSWAENRIELLAGDGRGGLRLPGRFVPTGRRPYEHLRTADFNRDGHADIVTTNLDDGTVSILLGDARGNFTPARGSPFPSGAKPWQVYVGDVNGDGDADLVVIPYQRDIANESQNVVTVLLGNGRGHFTPLSASPLSLLGCDGANSVTAGQLSRGRGLIVVGCAQSRNMILFERNGSGVYTSSSVPIKGGWGSVLLAPLTRDGRTGLITADADAGSITIFNPEKED